LLVEEGQLVLLERVEPAVPVELLQAPLPAEAGKVDTQDAGIAAVVARALHVRRFAAAGFHPVHDGLVVGGAVCACHDDVLSPPMRRPRTHARASGMARECARDGESRGSSGDDASVRSYAPVIL